MMTKDYFGEGKIAAIAKCEISRDKLLSQNLNVLFMGEQPVILPDEHYLSQDVVKDLYNLHDFDVVEFYTDDKFFIHYSCTSNDNALFVTSRCNSNCLMCPSGDNERRHESAKGTKQLCELIRYMPSDVPFITVTGGEPTLLKEKIFDIMECIKNHFEPETKIYFLTNGRAFCNEEFFNEFLNHIPVGIRFAVPLYGDTAEKHDHITQAKGSFDQTLLGIRRLIAEHMEIEIRVVVSKLNYKNMDALAKFIVQNLRGISSVHFMATEMRGSAAKNRNEVWIDYADAFDASKNAIRNLTLNNFDVKLYNFPLCKVSKSYWPLCEKSITDYKVCFYDSCQGCAVHTICGGVFKTTLLLTKMELNPIQEVQL